MDDDRAPRDQSDISANACAVSIVCLRLCTFAYECLKKACVSEWVFVFLSLVFSILMYGVYSAGACLVLLMILAKHVFEGWGIRQSLFGV